MEVQNNKGWFEAIVNKIEFKMKDIEPSKLGVNV